MASIGDDDDVFHVDEIWSVCARNGINSLSFLVSGRKRDQIGRYSFPRVERRREACVDGDGDCWEGAVARLIQENNRKGATIEQ